MWFRLTGLVQMEKQGDVQPQNRAGDPNFRAGVDTWDPQSDQIFDQGTQTSA